MSDLTYRRPRNLMITQGDHPSDRDRALRELQTMNNLLAARTEHESARTEMLFNRWRQRGSPIEHDVFPDDTMPLPHDQGETT